MILNGCTFKRRSAVKSTPLDLSVSTLRASWMERGGLPVIMPRISVIYEWMERGSLPVACITRSSKAGGGGGGGGVTLGQAIAHVHPSQAEGLVFAAAQHTHCRRTLILHVKQLRRKRYMKSSACIRCIHAVFQAGGSKGADASLPRAVVVHRQHHPLALHATLKTVFHYTQQAIHEAEATRRIPSVPAQCGSTCHSCSLPSTRAETGSQRQTPPHQPAHHATQRCILIKREHKA